MSVRSIPDPTLSSELKKRSSLCLLMHRFRTSAIAESTVS